MRIPQRRDPTSHTHALPGQPRTLDEQDLVAGLIANRPIAVSAFMERYRPLFFHCIGQFETDAHLRDDLYNEILTYVLDRLRRDSFDPSKGSFGTWLYRVAWCRCVDLKRREHARRQPRLLAGGERVPEQVDQGPGPWEVVGDAEVGDMVRRGMASLDPEDRALLELRFVEERTIGEIAEELAMSLEQAKYRLKRASTCLRRVLLNDLALEKAAE